jgi:hypothetical protein
MGLRSKPLPVLVDAFLRTEAFEGVAMPHHAELAVAVGAKVVHTFSRRPSRLRRRSHIMQRNILCCNAQLV